MWSDTGSWSRSAAPSNLMGDQGRARLPAMSCSSSVSVSAPSALRFAPRSSRVNGGDRHLAPMRELLAFSNRERCGSHASIQILAYNSSS